MNTVEVESKINTANITQPENTALAEKLNIESEQVFLQVQYSAEIVEEEADNE